MSEAVAVENTQDSQVDCDEKSQINSDDARPTVLVVEDSVAEQMRIVLLIEKFGYHAITANDGVEALQILESTSVDMVVSDWHMPNMDGMALCKEVRNLFDVRPYFLILTGRTNRGELIAAMDAGADDYLSKPIQSEELRVRVQAGLRLRRMSDELVAKNAMLKTALLRERDLNSTVQASLKAASKLQRSALPKQSEVINNIAIAHCFRPAEGVAGDSYSLLKLDDDHVAFYLVDVVGQGIRAAMQSYAIVKSLQERARQHGLSPSTSEMLCPVSIAKSLNVEFACDANCENYFTLVYGVTNVKSGEVRIVQAAHPHPYLVSPSGDVQKLGSGGFPIGLIEDADFDEFEFTLEEGCKLVFYSDGIFECALPNGAKFNESMLLQVLSNISTTEIVKLQQHLDTIIDRLIGNSVIVDDLSIFVIEKLKGQKEESQC